MSARSTVIKPLSVAIALASTLTLSACSGSATPSESSSPIAEQKDAPIVTEVATDPQPSAEELTEKARMRFEAALEAEAASAVAADSKMAKIVTYYCKTIEPMLGKKEQGVDRIALMQAIPSVYKKYWLVAPGSAQVMPYDFSMVATQYGCFYTPQ